MPNVALTLFILMDASSPWSYILVFVVVVFDSGLHKKTNYLATPPPPPCNWNVLILHQLRFLAIGFSSTFNRKSWCQSVRVHKNTYICNAHTPFPLYTYQLTLLLSNNSVWANINDPFISKYRTNKQIQRIYVPRHFMFVFEV